MMRARGSLVAAIVTSAVVFGACGSSGSSKSAEQPAATTSTAASTTTVQEPSDPTAFDWKNYRYPDRVCGTDKDQKLTNGEWMSPTAPLATCGMSFQRAGVIQGNGDGGGEAVVTILNNASGVARGVSYNTYVFEMQGGTPKLISTLDGEGFPPYSAGSIETWTRLLGPNDPSCCPSQYTITTYKYSNGTWAKTGQRNVPADQYPGGNG